MKRLLFLLVIAFTIFSCEQETHPTSAILTGTILNPKEDFATLRLEKNIDTSYFDNEHLFRFDISLEKGAYYVFAHGHEITTLFIEPGDSLYLTLNTELFDETIEYKGKGAEKNNYLKEKFMDNEKVNMDYKTLYSLPKDSFLLMINATKEMALAKLDKYKLIENANMDFFNLEKAKINLEWAISKFNYPSYYRYFTKTENTELDDSWYTFISDIDIQDASLKALPDFNNYLQSLIEYKANLKLKTDSVLSKRPHAKTAAKLYTINNLISDKENRNTLLYEIMKDKVKYQSINDIDSLFKEFSDFCTDNNFVSDIDSLINLWTGLAKGLPAPDFTAEDISGKEYKLSDFRGKYVYIDVWATWCGPCLREAPYLEEIEEEFADNNIVFLSVSIDNTREPWKEYLEKTESHGLQLYADKAWKSTLATEYLIHSIPRFMLFDREGNIIDVRAARPSGNIAETIRALDGI